MNRKLSTVLVGALALCASGVALGQGKARGDFGKREYDSKCAGCHGVKGKGDGVYKPFLTRSPSDLTTLAKANGGVFPYDAVYQVIDGRKGVPAHGPRDMPIWGADYLAAAAADYMDVPYDAEVYVRNRIMSLVDYLYRLQAR
ncbi:MAG TPA: c-type cytochrome [Anaeromyxobacteraceae bacterium]|jgi:mono/diheme cytochrome c family protein